MANVPQAQQLFSPSTLSRARALRRVASIPVTIAAGELRARRRQAGLGIIRAAELIGVTPGRLSRAERGLRHLGATRTVHALRIYVVVAKTYRPVKIAVVEHTRTGPVTEVMYPIAGGSGPVTHATREQLEQLALTVNSRRL